MSQKQPRSLASLLALAAALHWPTLAAAADDIVVVQALPLTGPGYATARLIQAGALAAIGRENANGGVHGRTLRLVTVDASGTPSQYTRELRATVERERAHLVINCVDDLDCHNAAQVASAAGVALFGPLSGAENLGGDPRATPVLTLRANYAREAAAIAAQLRSVGIGRVAVLADIEGEARGSLVTALLGRSGIQVTEVKVGTGASGVATAWSEATGAQVQAFVFAVGWKTVDALATLPDAMQRQLPSTLMSFASPGVTQLGRLFRGRVLGFSTVVPNPEVSQLPVIQELQADTERYGGPEGVTFEGLEAYMNVRAAAEFLRRQPRGTPIRWQSPGAMQHAGAIAIGGFRLDFGRWPRPASDWVDIGLRTRDGVLRR